MQVLTPSLDGTQNRYDAANSTLSPSGTSAEAFPAFAQALNDRRATPDQDVQTRAQKAAGALVAHALILPVLAQIRHSVWNQNGILAPGTGEKTFGPEFDTQVAERLAQSPKMQGLAASVANSYLRHRGVTPAEAAATRPASSPAQAAEARMDVNG